MLKHDFKINDLKVAHQELINYHNELEKCSRDLKIANENLSIKAIEKENLAAAANSNSEDIMFTISHKIRKSVANILGISKLLCDDENLGKEEWKEMLLIVIQSAESLNIATEQLSKLVRLKKQDGE